MSQGQNMDMLLGVLLCFSFTLFSMYTLARVLQLLGQVAEIPSIRLFISVLYIKTSIEISFTNVLSFSQTFREFLGFSYGISICKFHLYCQYARSILNMKKTKCFCNIFFALCYFRFWTLETQCYWNMHYFDSSQCFVCKRLPCTYCTDVSVSTVLFVKL